MSCRFSPTLTESNVPRSIVHHPKLIDIFDGGNLKFNDTLPTPPAPAPKEPKAPKEKAAPAEPKPKASKSKPKDDDEEEEPLVPAEPKVKNPLDDLPKSAFNLEEWKRQYSNNETRPTALNWFYEQ